MGGEFGSRLLLPCTPMYVTKVNGMILLLAGNFINIAVYILSERICMLPR